MGLMLRTSLPRAWSVVISMLRSWQLLLGLIPLSEKGKELSLSAQRADLDRQTRVLTSAGSADIRSVPKRLRAPSAWLLMRASSARRGDNHVSQRGVFVVMRAQQLLGTVAVALHVDTLNVASGDASLTSKHARPIVPSAL